MEGNGSKQTVKCNYCDRKLTVPRDVFEMIYSATHDVPLLPQGADIAWWPTYKLPDENETFLSLTGRHDGYYISRLTGAIYCNANCLLMYTED